MRAFGWLATTDIPAAYDLRRRGWQVEPARGTAGMASDGVSGLPVLVHRTALPAGEWLHLLGARDGTLRARAVLIGIGDPDERGRLLKLGFGDVVSSAVSLDELDVRADRLAAQAKMLPRHRDIGPLRLDLFARDGFPGDEDARAPQVFWIMLMAVWASLNTVWLGAALAMTSEERVIPCHLAPA